MNYTVVLEDRGFYISFVETVTSTELLGAFTAVSSHENLSGMRYKIMDFSYAKKFALSAADMKVLAQHDASTERSLGYKAAIAIIVNDPEGQILGEEYKRHIAEKGWSCGVFKKLATARGWLTAEGAHRHTSFAVG